MKFVLNVALHGQHYCRIKLPETQDTWAIQKAEAIAAKFPASEGFKLSLTRWNNTGREIWEPEQ